MSSIYYSVPFANILKSRCFYALSLCALLVPSFALSQGNDAAPPTPGTLAAGNEPTGNNPPEPQHKRIFLIIPNYRTFPSLKHYQPLTTRQKFKIATQDSFDPGTFALAAIFAGESDLTKQEPSFGHGASAYFSYFGTSYAGFVIGDYMTEAIFPSLLHQDPRYFRRGVGSIGGRIGYALDELVWTHNDSGSRGVNFSEIVGNSVAVAIGTAYYPNQRDAQDASINLITQIAVDGASNILKEFSPDIYRKFGRHRHPRNP